MGVAFGVSIASTPCNTLVFNMRIVQFRVMIYRYLNAKPIGNTYALSAQSVFETYFFYPSSVLDEECHPRKTPSMSAVKFFIRLELKRHKCVSNRL